MQSGKLVLVGGIILFISSMVHNYCYFFPCVEHVGPLEFVRVLSETSITSVIFYKLTVMH